jgi:hypothetical protein
MENEITVTTFDAQIFDAQTMASLLDKAKTLGDRPSTVSIIPRYKEFAPDETVRGVFCGTQTLDNGLRVAQWVDSQGHLWINGGTVLVSALAKLPPGIAIEIGYLGKRSTANGYKVNDFSVRLIPDDIPF